MRKFFILFASAVITSIISCGPKATQPVNTDDEDRSNYILRDTAIYGFCAEGSAMNTLQIITDAGDTITVSTARAQQKGKVLGEYAVGDEIALIANSDTTQAITVINKSMLNGDWVMPNPMDGSNEMGVRILRGGVAESIDQSSIVFKSWRLFNGQLQFIVTREDGIDMEEILVYDILKLTDDELVIRTADEDQETFEYGRPAAEEYTEEDLGGIELDEGYDDEFDM